MLMPMLPQGIRKRMPSMSSIPTSPWKISQEHSIATGRPYSKVRIPYSRHSKRIIRPNSLSPIPTERSMASSRLRSLTLVDMVLNTFTVAISDIMTMKTTAKRFTMNSMLRFSSSFSCTLSKV